MSLNFRKFVVYAMIFMTVFVLGCTGDSTATTGASDKGVGITEFSFDTSAVYHNEAVYLRMVLENQGQKQVTDDTSVFIYGQSISKDNPKHWKLDSVDVDIGTITDFDAEAGWVIPKDDFLPPQPEMGVPGGVAVLDATLTAPELEEGESTPYTFYTRVCYPYKTSMLSTITSSSSEEMRIQQDTSAVESVNTAGPIHLTLAGQSSIVARGDYIPVIFKISDVGGGFSTSDEEACDRTPEDLNRDKVDIQIEVDGVLLEGTYELYGKTFDKDCSKIVQLRNGAAELRCSIPIDRDTPTREYHIRAVAEYKYYVGDSTRVTVDYISD